MGKATTIEQLGAALDKVLETIATLAKKTTDAITEVNDNKLDTTGTAASAEKLAAVRTLKVGNASKSFDGTADVEWTLDEIGVASNTDLTALKLKILTNVTENEFTVDFDTLDAADAAGVWDETGQKIRF